MPRHSKPRTKNVPPAQKSPADVIQSPLADLTAEQVDRWATWIAEGGSSLPDDLSPTDWERVAAAVRDQLHERLVRYIARAIAARLHRRGRSKEDAKDA